MGEVRALVLDVSPRDSGEAGKFLGRIWVEDRGFRIVRFNGTYTSKRSRSQFLHFDSWRVQTADDFWAPAFIYVEDHDPLPGAARRMKAQTRLWGYEPLQPDRLQELTAIVLESENPIADPEEEVVRSPVERHRLWQRQAESNVIERLERSGLLAPPGELNTVLETVAGNLLAGSDLDLDVRCRVLLTTPLESFSIGNAIVVSRGLIDVLPDEAGLAMVLAGELAHIVLGHQTETMFAFSDRTMFDDREIIERLRVERTPEERDEAGERAIEILRRSPYRDDLGNAGLFLRAVAAHAPRLGSLIAANLGERWADGERLLRFSDFAERAPLLDSEKIEQIAALPLGSRVGLDVWTNETRLLPGPAGAVAQPTRQDAVSSNAVPDCPGTTAAGRGSGRGRRFARSPMMPTALTETYD